MRESIGKYRGKVLWNGNHYFSGDWVKGFYLENRKGESFIIDAEEDEFGGARFQQVQVDPDTVGEFTGEFIEKKEVYEGDKIEWTDIKNRKKTLEVIFISGGFMATDGNPSYALSIVTNLTMHSQQGKLIGTIHDKEKPSDN